MTDQIKVSTQDHVLTIAFNRPEQKNALTVAMYEAINDGMQQAEKDSNVRVVLFQGTESCFTSGNDLMDFMQNPPTSPDAPVFTFIKSLPVFPKPIVAAVAGAAVGIGVTMLPHCDLVLAADNAKFKMPFVSLGLVPEAGSTFLLPEMLGYAKAAELLLLAETFNADKAYELNLVNQVCTPEDILDLAQDRANQLAAQPPAAIRLTKQMLRRRLGDRLNETILYEAAEFGKRLASPEAQEAMQAFMQKRKPDFSKFT